MAEVLKYIKETVDTLKFGKEYEDSKVLNEDHIYIGRGNKLTVKGNYCVIGEEVEDCIVEGSYCIIQGSKSYIRGENNILLAHGPYSTPCHISVLDPRDKLFENYSTEIYKLEAAIKDKIALLKKNGFYTKYVDNEDPQVKFERLTEKVNRGEKLTSRECSFIIKRWNEEKESGKEEIKDKGKENNKEIREKADTLEKTSPEGALQDFRKEPYKPMKYTKFDTSSTDTIQNNTKVSTNSSPKIINGMLDHVKSVRSGDKYVIQGNVFQGASSSRLVLLPTASVGATLDERAHVETTLDERTPMGAIRVPLSRRNSGTPLRVPFQEPLQRFTLPRPLERASEPEGSFNSLTETSNNTEDNDQDLLSQFNTSLEEQKELLERVRRSSNETDHKLCTVCYENKINVVLLPCKHQILCEPCHQKLVQQAENSRGPFRCPKCRGKVNDSVKYERDGV